MVRKRSADASTLRESILHEPVHWGTFEVCSSALCITLCVLLIAAVALGVLELIGFGSISQWHVFGQTAVAGV